MTLTFLRSISIPINSRSTKNASPCTTLAEKGPQTALEPKDSGSSWFSCTSSTSAIDVEAQPERQRPSQRLFKGRWSKGFFWRPTAKTIKDATIGISDGMTVPFALMAGLSTFGSKKVVLLGGAAELIAGAISMAVGGWLGERAEKKSYNSAVVETKEIIAAGQAKETVTKLVEHFGIPETSAIDLFEKLEQSPNGLLNYIVAYHFNTSKPRNSAPWKCALTIGLGYLLGGFLPMIPYLFVNDHQVIVALCVSSGITAVALFVFGYVKTAVVEGWHGRDKVVSAVTEGAYMLVIGVAATGFAVIVTRAINHGL